MSTSRRFSLTFKSKKKAASSSTGKKTVSFKEEKNTIHKIGMIDRSDFDLLQCLWQQAWEMQESKDIIKVRAKQWRQTGMGVFLSDVFHCDKNLSPTLCQEQLNTFTQLPDEMHMRGCERYLSRKHDQERSTRKRTIIREVVSKSRTLHSQVRNKALKQAESEEALSNFARRLNQDAALFAARMAKADEVVVQLGCEKNTKPAMEMVDLKYRMALEQATAPPKSQLKKAPPAAAAQPQQQQQQPPAAAQIVAGRRLQARQA